jgi:DNA (cytosine-5)-methyltransferase 1
MRYLSLFSGIEAASVAWEPLGWEAVAFAETAKFPSAVLAYRFPNIPNLGDVTKYKEWQIERGSVGVMVGGSPCQSFSVAGLRKGLDDPRGNLMLTYGAIADHLRPTWIVWENVPGVLSSNRGRDFGTFLGMLGQLGYGIAYRVLDAEYFGVPQRRRRVFVVGYLGDWRRAAQVLFESESMCGYPPPSREKGEDVTEIAGTLSANGGGTNRPAGNCNELDFCISHTLNAKAGSRNNVEEETFIAFAENSRGEIRLEGGDGSIAGNLSQGGGKPGQGVPVIANTLTGSQHKSVGATGGNNPGITNPVISSFGVRRLTPRECERLQGFPDNFTDIPWRGKPNAPDGLRYTALGNSMAVPVMRWIGERIERIMNE